MILKKFHFLHFIVIAILFFLISTGTSCIAPHKVIYFNDIPDHFDSTFVYPNPAPFIEPRIESNDILTITIQTIEQSQTNTPITSNSIAAFNPLNGFLVDKNGNIELSLIGFVKVGGLTTSEARELIKQKAREYYKEPVVNCRIVNFDVLVLGDVGKPGLVEFPSEKGTVLDAIAQTSDVNLTARKDDVLLIRTENQQKKFVRLNLNSTSLFQSPYYYLKQRDVLIFTPRKPKIRDSDNRFVKYLGIATSLVSITTLLIAYRNYKL